MTKSEKKEAFKWILLILGLILISSALFLYFGENCMKCCCIIKILCGLMVIGLIGCFIGIFCCIQETEQNCEPLCRKSKQFILDSETDISLVYAGKDKKSKICYAKFYDESELTKLLVNIDKNEKIYILKDTKINKVFFENLKNVHYEVIFNNNNAYIEITK